MLKYILEPFLSGIQYITLRSGAGAVTGFLVSLLAGSFVIRWFRAVQISEQTDKVDSEKLAELHAHKQETPSMGGLFFIGATVLSALLWTNLSNILVWICLFVTVSLGILGFLDDYDKLKHPSSHGITIPRKLLWQSVIGLAAGFMMFFYSYQTEVNLTALQIPLMDQTIQMDLLYPPFVMLMVVSTANAVNFSDGLDGLAIGLAILVALTYAVISYITGRVDFSAYLDIMYVRGAGEVSIIMFSLAGASLGFLWYNCHPAQIFMGDTGSLPLGGMLGIVAALSKQELILVITGGVFVLEALSVVLQICSVRLFGTRVFRIAPLHHHFQFKGIDENKIVIRFWIVAVLCVIISLSLIKL